VGLGEEEEGRRVMGRREGGRGGCVPWEVEAAARARLDQALESDKRTEGRRRQAAGVPNGVWEQAGEWGGSNWQGSFHCTVLYRQCSWCASTAFLR